MKSTDAVTQQRHALSCSPSKYSLVHCRILVCVRMPVLAHDKHASGTYKTRHFARVADVLCFEGAARQASSRYTSKTSNFHKKKKRKDRTTTAATTKIRLTLSAWQVANLLARCIWRACSGFKFALTAVCLLHTRRGDNRTKQAQFYSEHNIN